MENEYENEECVTKEQTSCLVSDQSSHDGYGTDTPSCGRKSECVQFEHILQLRVSKLRLSEWSTVASAKVIRPIAGIRFIFVATKI